MKMMRLQSIPIKIKRSNLPQLRKLSSKSLKDNDVVVCSFVRTPILKVGGAFSGLSAPKLMSQAIIKAVERAGIKNEIIEEAYIGNVVSAGIGQAPSRQAIIYAGLPLSIATTDINKVCASGMKAVMLSAMSISCGYRNVILAGGMESMSNIPYYLPNARQGYRLGHQSVVDGMIFDGLWDPYSNQHMGMCGEDCAQKFSISRQDQDDFAINSYQRASDAWKNGNFNDEVIHVSIPGKKGESPNEISIDDEFTNIKLDKIKNLRPAFKKDGTVTAFNASKLNDGAAAMILTSGKYAKENKLTPLFRIRGYGDAAREPIEFTIAPADAIPRALKHSGLDMKDVEYHEINEAFAVVPIANSKLLNLDMNRVNVFGGAIALGHPIGCSGSRIIGTLYSVLKSKDATIGCASICNGGGGASAVIIERLN